MESKPRRRDVITTLSGLPILAAAPARAADAPPALVTPWIATCAQTATANLAPAKSKDDARAILAKAMEGFERQVANAAERRSDLILFPEYMMGGPESDLKGVLDFPGPEIELVQHLAQKYRMFIGGHAYTRDRDFPGRYFNTSFLIDRAGNIVLRYYRIHTYHSHSPHDFWQRFLDKVGVDGAFPVARTELGNISMLPSMEFIYPEITRMFVLRGAEVILHDTAEQIVDESVKRARAVENMVFVLSTNTPSSVGRKSMRVGSRIIDWEGEVMARVEDGAAGQCTTILDVEGLRKRRSDPDLIAPAPRGFLGANYLSRMRVEVCREVYNSMSIYPGETYREGAVATTNVTPEKYPDGIKKGLSNLVGAGLIPPTYFKG